MNYKRKKVKIMFDKFKKLAELNRMRKEALRLQKELKKERVEIFENGIKVVVSGDQKIEELEIDGTKDKRITEAINKALKKSQENAAKKLQELSGGMTGLLKGLMGS